jgi:hypothetical protein
VILFLSFAFLQTPTGIPAAAEPVRREYGVAGGPAADEPVRREYETGSRLSKRANVSVWDADKTRKIQADFGQCVIKKHLAPAQHFVLTPNMEKSEWRKDVSAIADGYCLGVVAAAAGDVEMKFPVDTMRYALADALARKEFSAGAAASIKDAAPLEQPKLKEEDYQLEPGKRPRKGELEQLRENRQKQQSLIYLAGFGECVVRADPANSYALVMSDAETPQEDAAFKGLMPAYGGCLTAGQSLSFNKSTLRGTIAMNYYRLAHAPRFASASAGGAK